MALKWQHRYIRSGSVTFGTSTFSCDGKGFLSPQPSDDEARFMNSHPSYAQGEAAEKKAAALPPKPKTTSSEAAPEAPSPKPKKRSRKRGSKAK